jgi:hypothetical protein
MSFEIDASVIGKYMSRVSFYDFAAERQNRLDIYAAVRYLSD